MFLQHYLLGQFLSADDQLMICDVSILRIHFILRNTELMRVGLAYVTNLPQSVVWICKVLTGRN